ncbi:MAG: bifunctional phosphopantothenoylcysteine decarboxylase/phosphopantothenate--cysteine ligase CoaBC [Armatimonadota bacterium]|nr:bifunctional phosphopantothenoylcysteine decarboxylase/phosphopantothenate--cysteine ligase CoaBC [Armatimonadota bacterium]
MSDERTDKPLDGKRIILGVTGSIAAYKAAELASRLTQLGATVHAILTKNACEFISPLTFRSLTGNPPLTGLFDEPRETGMAHIDIPTGADLLLIAPATANIIGKMASGIADDWLSTAAMVVQCPVVIAPAMNCNMYTNPVVKRNVERLEELGYTFVEPESGRLACGTEGVGRLADPEVIIAEVVSKLRKRDLAGMRLLVTAGPTRERIDAVRFISNDSSGKMGYALARAAAARGAAVTLVSGPTHMSAPANVDIVPVESAKEMRDAVIDRFGDIDVVISAAAVADYTPSNPAAGKIKKTDAPRTLQLEPTEDILKTLGERKTKQILVGFAAETENLIENATQKIKEKNLDLIVANEVAQEERVFGSDSNTVTLITAAGAARELPRMTKLEVADNILDFVRDNHWRAGI